MASDVTLRIQGRQTRLDLTANALRVRAAILKNTTALK